eukprot:1003-Chlamydomonas_euryale.AAC.9
MPPTRDLPGRINLVVVEGHLALPCCCAPVGRDGSAQAQAPCPPCADNALPAACRRLCGPYALPAACRGCEARTHCRPRLCGPYALPAACRPLCGPYAACRQCFVFCPGNRLQLAARCAPLWMRMPPPRHPTNADLTAGPWSHARSGTAARQQCAPLDAPARLLQGAPLSQIRQPPPEPTTAGQAASSRAALLQIKQAVFRVGALRHHLAAAVQQRGAAGCGSCVVHGREAGQPQTARRGRQIRRVQRCRRNHKKERV